MARRGASLPRLSRIYHQQLGTPRARAEWVIRFLRAGAAVKSPPAWLRWPPDPLRLELSAFARGWAEGGISLDEIVLSREQARTLYSELQHLFTELRDGGSEAVIRVDAWQAEVRTGRAGRLTVRPLLLEMDGRDAFFWRLAEALSNADVRVAFCPTCRGPFVARKAQRYCRPRCAPSGAERNRRYRQRHRVRLNETRKARYRAARRKQFGPNVYVGARRRS